MNALRQAVRSDRRTTVRYPSQQKGLAKLTRAIGGGMWMARIRNVSAEGIGLIVDQPIKKGMLLTIELPTKSGQKPSIPKQIKITHVAQQPGTTWWVLGGVFASKLTKEEIDALR